MHLANKKSVWYEFHIHRGSNGYSPDHPLRNSKIIGEAERLHALCQTPAPAHELLARYQRSAAVPIATRDALTALQRLLRDGALQPAASPPSDGDSPPHAQHSAAG